MARGASALLARSAPQASAIPQMPAATAIARMVAGNICLSRNILAGRYRHETRSALLLGAFQAQDDVDLVTQRAFHELHVVIAALDRETRLAAADGLALSAFAVRASLEVHRDRLGDTMDGEIAADLVALAAAFDFAALEGDCGELLRVEKVRAFEVLIALLVPRINAFHRYRQLDGAFRRIGRVERHRAGNRFERSVKIGHAVMLDAEDDGGMNRIDRVGIGAVGREREPDRAEDAGEGKFGKFHKFLGEGLTIAEMSALGNAGMRGGAGGKISRKGPVDLALM